MHNPTRGSSFSTAFHTSSGHGKFLSSGPPPGIFPNRHIGRPRRQPAQRPRGRRQRRPLHHHPPRKNVHRIHDHVPFRSCFHHSDFGFDSDFEFRISSFSD